MSHSQERASGKRRGSGINEGQDLASHDRGPMSAKPSSLSEETDNRILRGYYGGYMTEKPMSMSTLGQGPSLRKNPSSAMGRILLGMDIAEDKRGNLPLAVTLQIVPQSRESTKALKDNGENGSV